MNDRNDETISLLIKNTKVTITEKAMLTSKFRNTKKLVNADYTFEEISEECKNYQTMEMSDTERDREKKIALVSKGKFC